jgi:uncharacterized membrane protein YvbJ
VVLVFLKGNIISGEFDEGINEFSLQQVKHFSVESTINENQMKILYHYLKEHQNDKDGQIITLYDQMPVRLSQKEVFDIISDLEKVLSMY